MYQREFFFFGSFFLFASLICFTPSSHSLCFPLRGKRSLVISALFRVFGCFAPAALRKFASEQKEKMNKKIFLTSASQNKQRKKYFVLKERWGGNPGTYGDYRLSSNRKVLKRTFFVLFERLVGVETPVPTVMSDYSSKRKFQILKTYPVEKPAGHP